MSAQPYTLEDAPELNLYPPQVAERVRATVEALQESLAHVESAKSVIAAGEALRAENAALRAKLAEEVAYSKSVDRQHGEVGAELLDARGKLIRLDERIRRDHEEITGLYVRLAEAEAGAAALRAALEAIRAEGWFDHASDCDARVSGPCDCNVDNAMAKRVVVALATNAGRDLLQRIEKARELAKRGCGPLGPDCLDPMHALREIVALLEPKP